MAVKQKKTSKKTKLKKKSALATFSFDKLVPSKYQLIILAALILLVFLIFYSPLYFGGKTFQSGDIITSQSAKTYLENHEDGYTLWNPYVFNGMPAYAIAVGYKWFNLIYVSLRTARDIFSIPFTIDYAKWTFYLIALAYTMFIFMMSRTKNKLVSLLVSLASSFSTGIVVFLFIGHVTKLAAIWVFPIILLLLFNFQKKIKFVDAMLLIIFLDMMFIGWHVQIIFYMLFAVLIYFIYYFPRSLIIKDKLLTKQLAKSAVVFIGAVIIALLIQADNFTQIWEYNPFSTRGTESILEKQSIVTEQSESDFYQYATNWSFSPGEVLTFIIPSYYGFGKSTYRGPLSQNQPVEVNTYFGQMPFVDVAQYMGVIIFFLAIFSMIINWKDPLVRYLTILSLVALLISFGRTFPFLYDLMFNYFPFFDKFRVPSMILVLVHLSFPILAGLGIAKIISLKNESDKKTEILVRNTALVFTGLLALTLILASPIKEWFLGRVSASGRENQQIIALHDYMADMFITDARLAFFFSAAVFGMFYAYFKSKLSTDLMVIAIALLIIIDVVRIDLRGETYVEYSQIEQLFNKPEYIQAIESTKDNSIYRILNLKQDGSIGSLNQNSNFNAYFLQQDLYGFSGIKPRAFQDYMDVLGSPANPTLWRMANVKYIVFDNQIDYPGLQLIYSGNKTFVYKNTNVLPRAYFVNSIDTRTAMELLNDVKNNLFDPKEIAYVEDESITVEEPDSTVFVKIESYKDETITLNVNASGNNFLFLGDTYLSGVNEINIFGIKIISYDVGWKAYIDGSETKIYKANHNFRGIVVPEGKHKVEFVYLPSSFVISKYLTLILSIILTLTIIGLLVKFILTKKQKNLQTTV
ncbi:MAG: YfhO family protein [Bacteroidetes bacterium]|nr:YfhO family protein [Bacteroidota bacterium]